MIITIDDNNDLNELTCQLLSMMGFEVIPATSGEEGIKKARKQKPRIILCDIGMSGMNGYEVANFIRNDEELKDIYMIAVSGYSRKEDVEKAMEAGFDRHLSKPVDFMALREDLNVIYKG